MERSEPERRRSLKKWMIKKIVAPFAAPRLDVSKDFGKVREAQHKLAAVRTPSRKSWEDHTIPGLDGDPDVAVRLFRPRKLRDSTLLLFFHGGGWVTGDIESYTPACMNMAEYTGRAVASVDYRLAPEHPFPAGLRDCYQAARTLIRNPRRWGLENADDVVLVGDSAGGNLAAAVSLLIRDRRETPAEKQILLYPVAHWDHDPRTSPFASVREHGEDYRLTNTEVQEYLNLYVPDPGQRTHPLVAPLKAEDLSDQPQTLLMSAELDLLRDEGEAYGLALRAAGNDVAVHRVPNALHGFITLPRLARPMRDAYRVIGAFLDGHRVEVDRVDAAGATGAVDATSEAGAADAVGAVPDDADPDPDPA
jgi:acetyl esterase/lipase